jgi:Caspase domain
VSDHALLVGCDAYPGLPGGDLRAAVRDTLAVRDWLLRDSGGGLARQDITMLVSCSAGGAQAEAGDVDGPASRREMARAVRRLVEGPEKRRLYIYFAGHGCRTDPDNPLKSRDAILLTDFTPDDPASASIGVEDLRRRLAMAPFREVIVIVDACRDLPFRNSFDLGSLGFDLPPRAGGQGGASRVYVLQATAPGETAAGAEQDGELRGVVSRALTDGLTGIGAAKIFDDTDSTGRPYQVRWSTLCDYIAQSVRGQTPRNYGEGDLVLAAFPDSSFSPVRLSVGVGGGPATDEDLARLSVRVTWPVTGDDEDGDLSLPGPPPVTLEVPPRRHRITARAGLLTAKKSVDLYADSSVHMILRRPVIYRGVGDLTRAVDPDAAASGAVVITTDDPAGVRQMRDGAGTVLGTEVGMLQAEMAPGSYTAVAVGLEGAEQHQPADLSAGELTSIRLSCVAPEGWPFRPGPLAWASPAAWVAGADPGNWSAGLDGSGIVVLAVEAYGGRTTVPGSVTLTPVRSRPGNRPLLVNAHVLRSAPDRALVDGQDVRLDVPVLEGAVTSIVVSGERASVGLFDLALLDEPHLVVELDRAQNLLGAGRSGPAGVLLGQILRRSSSRVARVLLEGMSSAVAPPVLAAGTPASVAHRLLGGTPWAVLITPVRRSVVGVDG